MASPTERLIMLQSSEGEIFEVPLEVANVSRTLSTMLRDLGHEQGDIIPLPNVTSAILKRVVAWAEHSVEEGLDLPTATPLHPEAPRPPSHVTPVIATPTSPTSPNHTALPFQPRPQPRVSHRTSSHRVLPPPGHTLSSWEKEFLTHNKDKVHDLLLAANYLDIKSLLDVLCKAVAGMIKGRDPQDIRRVFHASDPTDPSSISEDSSSISSQTT